MTYAIIHSNPDTLEKSLLDIVNRYLKTKLISIDDIKKDPDFCIIEKEGEGSIKIEQIKKLQKKLIFSPFNNTHQFGIIKDAYLMTPEAQNALLKTLEECHENTILILTINNEEMVLKTILSRCNRIYPKGGQREEESKDFSEVQEFLQKPLYEKINEIEYIIKGKKTDDFLENLVAFFRNEYKEKLKKREDVFVQEKILKLLQQAKQRIRKNVNTKIALEFICFQIDKYLEN